MKPNAAEQSIEGVCRLLKRSPLLTAAEVDALLQRWQRVAREPSNVAAFQRWLVEAQYLSEFQLTMVLQGHGELLVLNEYRLIARIGRGRLTTVYQAMNRVGHFAALKVLPPSRATDKATLAWFQREATLGKQLQHHNLLLPRGHDEANGVHYLIMDFLEGETLQHLLERRGKLSPQEAVEVVVQALEGLQYLHGRNIVLRNIEPANLMLVMPKPGTLPPDVVPQPTVRLLDFSFCRFPDEKPVEGRGRGKGLEGNPLSSPAYLAPEQARDASKADIRSDLYSLGCVLYHALAGRPPFVDADPAKQVGLHLTATAAPVTQYNPEVPEGLALIVGWMIARDPANRYQTPDQAATALRAFLATLEPAIGAWPGSEPHLTIEPVPSASVELLPVEAAPNVELVPALETERDLETLTGPAEPLVPPPPSADEMAFTAAAAPRSRRRPPPDRRAALYVLLGGCGVLAAQAAAWVLGRLLAAWRAQLEEAPGRSEK